LNPAQ